MSHYKKLAGETFIYGLGTIVPRFLNFIVLTPFFTRVLSKAEYGLFSEIYAYAYLFLTLLTYGTETGYFKFANNSNYNEKNVFRNLIGSILLSTSLFIVLSFLGTDAFVGFLQFGGNALHFKIFFLIVSIDVLSSIPFARLRHKKKIYRFSIIKIINVVVNIALVSVLLLFENIELKVEILFSNYKIDKLTLILFSNLIASLSSLLLLLPEVSKFKIGFNFKFLKPILIYSLPLLVAGLAGALNETLDKILLRFLYTGNQDPYELLGVYTAGYKMAVIITLFIQMFRFAAEPYFFSIEKEKDSKTVYGNILKYFFIFVALVFLVITFYIDFFKFYLGKDFYGGLFVVPIVLLANVLYGLLINVNFWFKLSGKTIWAIYIVGGGALLTIISNVILIPIIDIRGCAWSHVISYGGMLIFSFLIGQKKYKITYDLKRLGGYALISSIIFVIGFYVPFKTYFLTMFIRSILLVLFFVYIEHKEQLIKSFFIK